LGKKRCRLHGGAAGSGAPRGNKNALKSGFYTRKQILKRRRETESFRQLRALIKNLV
jgi:hypothetical protein